MAIPSTSRQLRPTAMPDYWPPPQGAWTYDDYARLPDNGMRYEVIQGDLYMSPAPRPKHQQVIARLYGYLWDYLKQKPIGQVFFAPIDLILPDLANPVQPDLLFIRNEHLDIVKEKFIEGVPDLIVEVLSPSNPNLDRRLKFQVYAQAGVQEYWLIDPDAYTVEVNVLRGQAYALAEKFSGEAPVRSEVLADFSTPAGDICSPD